MSTRIVALASLAALGLALPAHSQNPRGAAVATVDGARVVVDYGRPALKAGRYSLYLHVPSSGRWALVLNSDLGQPLGSIWKDAPENLKNAPYPYLGDYEQKIRAKEVLRVELRPNPASAPAESFTISFAPTGGGSTMTLAWGDQAWSTEVQPSR